MGNQVWENSENFIHEIVEGVALKKPDKPAIIYMGKCITYKQFVDKFHRFASSLARLGVKEDDRVGIYLPNTPQALIAFYGISKLGAGIVLKSPILTAAEVEFILKENKIKTVICSDVNVGNIIRIEESAGLENIIVTRLDDEVNWIKRLIGKGFGRVPSGYLPKHPKVLSYHEIVKSKPTKLVRPSGDPREKIAYIVYTGGTTGTPKGVAHTHFTYLSGVKYHRQFLRLHFKDIREGEERWCGYQPFYHLAGVIFLNLSLFRGETVYVFPNPDIDAVLTEVRRRKMTLLAGAPTFYTMVLGNERLDQYLDGLRKVKYVFSGADALPPDVFERWKEVVGQEILQTWGASESYIPMHNIPGEADLSLGAVVPGYEVALLDPEEDKFLEEKDGAIGEAAVKGPAIFKEYVNKPEETKEVLVTINGEVWYRTGDIVRVKDENGKRKLYFEDRIRDIIKYKGYNVGASEVEQAIYGHPAVKEAAVIGIPDKSGGEIVKAVVVLHDDAKNVTMHDLMEVCRQRLAPVKMPKHIEFRDALPKSPHTGKILKRELREEELLKRKHKA